MGVKDAVRKAVKYVTDKVDGYREQQEEDRELSKAKKLLERAMGEHDIFRGNAAKWDEQYNGTKAVGSAMGANYISDRERTDRNQTTQDARQVVNITLQLIEAQIDTTVPQPAVEAIEGDDNDERRKMIEGQLTYMTQGAEFLRINSENERIVKKNSICAYKISYDPDYSSHKWIGKVCTSNPHPTNIIPQLGMYRVKDMDYLFHIENRSIDQIVHKYGEDYKIETGNDLRDDLEAYGSKEYNYLEDFSAETRNTDSTQEKYSVVEKWYKDKDRDPCLYVWCGMIVLRKVEKFFYKRDDKGEIMEYEDIEIQKPQIRPDGQPVMGPNGQPQMTTETVQVKCHVPKEFPFIIQYNIPREKSYVGKSDPEMIYDQQEGIKKMLSIEEEKLIKGTTKIITRKGTKLKDQMNNATLQILETENPTADIQVIQMHTNEQSYKDLYGIYTQAAKDLLGVTDASQGRTDTGGLSGKAIDALAAYSQGRSSIKKFEKEIAYMEVYRMLYDFLLAYYDEPRPFRIDGPENKPVFGYFDKAKLIKQDDAGEWYYPPFDIMIRTDSGIPKDKRFVIDSANKAGDRMDNVEYWMVMDSVGFPNSGAILDREKKKEEAASNKPPTDLPNESISFKDIPVSAKIQMLAKVGIQATPEDFAGDPILKPEKEPEKADPIDAHAQAMEITKLQLEQKQIDDKQAHEVMMAQMKQDFELQKMELQAQITANQAKEDAKNQPVGSGER